MMKSTSLTIFVMTIHFLQGCATVDIRPEMLKADYVQEDLALRGQKILDKTIKKQDPLSNWHGFKKWEIITRDVWKSNLVRKLTPITEKEQLVEFQFDLNKDKAEMKYLNGRHKEEIIGIENQKTYRIKNGTRIDKNDNKTKLYLAPVRDYYFWPQTLVKKEIVIYAGDEQYNDRNYIKVFVTDDDLELSSKRNQYIVWVNNDSWQIDYVEFTLRELLKSYKGVVQYDDYRLVENMKLPYRIKLKDKIDSPKHSHEFVTKEMRFY